TGSMSFDRTHRVAYAALSLRTDEGLFRWFCNDVGYRPVTFRATQLVGSDRFPVYHTNVMLSVAENFAVVCLESIQSVAEREMLTDQLQQTGKEIVEISLEQMGQFSGNVLQLKNTEGERFLVISESGY